MTCSRNARPVTRNMTFLDEIAGHLDHDLVVAPGLGDPTGTGPTFVCRSCAPVPVPERAGEALAHAQVPS